MALFNTRTCTVAATPVLAGVFFFAVPTVCAHATPPVISFRMLDPVPAGAQSVGVALADYNGDGNLDVANTNYDSSGDDNVGVLLGDGAGGLGTMANYPVKDVYNRAEWVQPIAAADLNGDGAPDIVVDNYYSGRMSVLLNKNDGSGTFNSAVNYETSRAPHAVATGDMNGDGVEDVVIVGYANTSAGVDVFLNNGNGTFAPKITTQFNASATFADSLAVGDITGDGKADVVAGNDGGGNAITLLVGNGSGGFSSQSQTSNSGNSGRHSIAVADLTNSGRLDAVVSEDDLSQFAVALNNGSGGLADPSNVSTSNGPVGVALADYNGDGFIDTSLGRTYNLYGQIAVLTGDGLGGFGNQVDVYTKSIINGASTTIGAGDMNNDGRPDIVTVDNHNGSITVNLNTTTFAAPTVASVAPSSGPTTGGTPVTITGTNLGSAYSVKFGAAAATTFTVNSPTSITATTPAAAAAGASTITIKTGGGTATGSYTYTGGTTGKKPQYPGACADFPARLPTSGTKKLISKTCVTNAGQKITVTATAKIRKRGDIRLYKIYKKRGATYIRTYGHSINLRLTYKAPATSTFSAYKATSKAYKL